ncbi:unnamed protein product [Ectocarpus sp. 13 AM-2016]
MTLVPRTIATTTKPETLAKSPLGVGGLGPYLLCRSTRVACRPRLLARSMNSVDFVEKEIDSNNVVVFSKSYCPFCTRTKNLFAGLGVDATVYELDQMDDGEAIQAILGAKTGQTTVPNVFVKGTHVGGNDAVQAANSSGALKTLLDG